MNDTTTRKPHPALKKTVINTYLSIQGDLVLNFLVQDEIFITWRNWFRHDGKNIRWSGKEKKDLNSFYKLNIILKQDFAINRGK